MSMPAPPWTRRRLLRTLPAAAARALLAPSLLAHPLRARASAAAAPPPFSRFTDIASAAGLSQPSIYGGVAVSTYILEVTGCGCAFIDYDNDGWMDIFQL